MDDADKISRATAAEEARLLEEDLEVDIEELRRQRALMIAKEEEERKKKVILPPANPLDYNITVPDSPN